MSSQDCPCQLSRRSLLAGASAFVAGGGFGGCSTNPATGRDSFTGFYSIRDDIKMGEAEYPNLIRAFGGAYDNARLQTYVTQVRRTLAILSELPDIPWEFTVLNTPIVNALALPGGKIAITRGLLAVASNEAEVAGVLAHEIGHVTARHTAQRQSRGMLANLGLAVLGVATQNSQLVQLGQTVASGYLQGYSRSQEFQSDTLGVRYLSRASYDPEAMATFLASLREHSQLEARLQGLDPGTVDQRNMMASHPRTIERVRQALAAAETTPAGSETTNREAYLDAINGMIFGDDPDQGYVRGKDFLHAGMKFAFSVPDGFVLQNGTTQVAAEDRNGAAIVFDADTVKRSRSLSDYIQNEWAEGIPLQNVETLTVNGIQAATGWTRLNTQGGVADARLVAYNWGGAQVLRFLFISPADRSRAYAGAFRQTTYSFRRLSDSEAGELSPLRLITAVARANDTVRSLSSALPYQDLNDAWFRMLNDLGDDASIPVGQTLKIVTS